MSKPVSKRTDSKPAKKIRVQALVPEPVFRKAKAALALKGKTLNDGVVEAYEQLAKQGA